MSFQEEEEPPGHPHTVKRPHKNAAPSAAAAPGLRMNCRCCFAQQRQLASEHRSPFCTKQEALLHVFSAFVS